MAFTFEPVSSTPPTMEIGLLKKLKRSLTCPRHKTLLLGTRNKTTA